MKTRTAISLGLILRQLVCVASMLCSMGLAQAAAVVIVASDRSTGYGEVRDVLVSELERSPTLRGNVGVRSVSEWTPADTALLGHSRVVIALGRDALIQVLASNVQVPVIAAMIPRAVFEGVIGDAAKKPSSPLTALYLDHPVGRQLDLLKLALPDARKVGVLWGRDSVSHQRQLAAAAQARGLELASGSVGPDGAIFAGLKAALDEADVLLAIADPQVFNSANISNILLTTYRARVPVMAFSPAYVRAGALLSLYTTPSQIGVQAAAMAKTVVQGGPLPAPQYPVEYVVGVNAYVARSLELVLDGASLAERLHRLEKRP
ncbi:MAG: hypothetical protein IPN06_01905 [Burkholderiales bacterium]|nr:hypothetical protein [Burkholderiales bacterium]